jgi:predicted transcriptional regulator
MKTSNMPELPRNIESKLAQRALIERGLASRDAAKQSGKYVSSEEVLRELDRMLTDAKNKAP